MSNEILTTIAIILIIAFALDIIAHIVHAIIIKVTHNFEADTVRTALNVIQLSVTASALNMSMHETLQDEKFKYSRLYDKYANFIDNYLDYMVENTATRIIDTMTKNKDSINLQLK